MGKLIWAPENDDGQLSAKEAVSAEGHKKQTDGRYQDAEIAL